MSDQKPSPDQQSPAQSLPESEKKEDAANKPSPTRYGDWEKAGRCIDF